MRNFLVWREKKHEELNGDIRPLETRTWELRKMNQGDPRAYAEPRRFGNFAALDEGKDQSRARPCFKNIAFRTCWLIRQGRREDPTKTVADRADSTYIHFRYISFLSFHTPCNLRSTKQPRNAVHCLPTQFDDVVTNAFVVQGVPRKTGPHCLVNYKYFREYGVFEDKKRNALTDSTNNWRCTSREKVVLRATTRQRYCT
jgi:hypothetical protein